MLLGRVSLLIIVFFLIYFLSGFFIGKDFFYFIVLSILVYSVYVIYGLYKNKHRLLSLLVIISFIASYLTIFEYLFKSEVIFFNGRIGVQSFNGDYLKLVSFTSIFSTGLIALSLGLNLGKIMIR